MVSDCANPVDGLSDVEHTGICSSMEFETFSHFKFAFYCNPGLTTFSAKMESDR